MRKISQMIHFSTANLPLFTQAVGPPFYLAFLEVTNTHTFFSTAIGTGTGTWAEAYQKAAAMVAQMTLDEKVRKLYLFRCGLNLNNNLVEPHLRNHQHDKWLLRKYPPH